MQQVGHFADRMLKFILLASNIFYTIVGNRLNLANIFGQFGFAGQPQLTADHNKAGGGKGLASDAHLRFFF